MKKRLVIISLIGLCPLALLRLRPSSADPLYQGQPLSFWIDHLTISSARFNEALTAFGAMDTNAVPYLARVLRLKDSPVERSIRANWVILPKFLQDRIPKPGHPNNLRIKAAEALRLLGPRAKAAVPDLIETLSNPDAMLRAGCIAGLEAVGPEARSAVPALTELFKDDVPHVRALAANAIWAILGTGDPTGGNAQFMLNLLQHPEPMVRLGAAECLLEKDLSTATLVLPVLEPLMRFGAAAVRPLAAHAITKSGATGDLVLAACLALLQHPVIGVRADAFNALEELGPMGASAVPELLSLLNDRDQDVRARAAGAFAYVGIEKEGVVEALLRLLREGDKNAPFDQVLFHALRALQLGGTKDPSVIRPLIEFLNRANPMLGHYAINILGNCCPAAVEAVPALKGFFAGETNQLRSAAAQALGKMGSAAEPALPEIFAALRDGDPAVRIAAAVALQAVFPSRRPEALTVLAGEIRTPTTDRVCASAGNALAKIDGLTPDLVTALRMVMRGRNHDIYSRLVAASALWLVDPKDSEACGYLISPLQAPQNREAGALGALGQPSPEILHRPSFATEMAAHILGDLGPAATPAIPALASALNNTNRSVRLAVRRALKKIAAESAAESTVTGSDRKETPRR